MSMGDSSHPSKKPRLDQTSEACDWDDAANDDLWGQDELTAEEFDFLETQATQLVAAKQCNVLNVSQVGQTSVNLNASTSSGSVNAELERLKLERYELEGKNKALTQLLEKRVEELNTERSNRDQIINQSLTELKQKESDLLKEVDKLQTNLHFQEQETRTERSKIFILENRLKERRKGQVHANGSFHETSLTSTPVKKSPIKTLHWNSFVHEGSAKTESGVQTEAIRHRKYQLTLQNPRGEQSEIDVVHKLLACRVMDPFAKNDPLCSEGNASTGNEICKIAKDFSTMCVAMLRNVKESDSIWKPYEAALQEYVRYLKTEQKSLSLPGKVYVFQDEGIPPLDFNRVQNGILTCLKDLSRLLFIQCPKEPSGNLKELNISQNRKNNDSEAVASQSSLSLFEDDEESTEMQSHGCCLQELLVMLANPITYPKNYKMTCEIEWALAALVAWSSHSKESFRSLEPYVKDLPLHSLICAHHGLECAYLAVKLMFQLIGSNFLKAALAHHSDSSCIKCSIGRLCLYVHCESSGNPVQFVTLIVAFMSGALTYYDFIMINQESDACTSKILNGLITMLLRHMRTTEEFDVDEHTIVMQKGVTLLYLLYAHLPRFKALRSEVEENYIALIGGLSALCKENDAFRKLQGMIRDLWDFQDDSAEFDGEDDILCTQDAFFQASAAL